MAYSPVKTAPIKRRRLAERDSLFDKYDVTFSNCRSHDFSRFGVPMVEFVAQARQLSCHLRFGERKDSIDDTADPIGAGRNERSIQHTPDVGLKVDRGRIDLQIDLQVVPDLLAAPMETASARVISASASWNARVDSAPWF